MLNDGVGMPLLSDCQELCMALHWLLLIYNQLLQIIQTGWRLKRLTNGDANTVYHQKPMFGNSVKKDRITYCTKCKQHRQQSTVKKSRFGIPIRVHPHLPGLTLTQYTTWLIAQKARTSSRGHYKGLCIIQCGGWLTRIFSTLFAIRLDKRYRWCMMD